MTTLNTCQRISLVGTTDQVAETFAPENTPIFGSHVKRRRYSWKPWEVWGHRRKLVRAQNTNSGGSVRRLQSCIALQVIDKEGARTVDRNTRIYNYCFINWSDLPGRCARSIVSAAFCRSLWIWITTNGLSFFTSKNTIRTYRWAYIRKS